MTGLVHNKVGIVTGAGSGIGRASALLFAAEGARVIVSDILADAGEETVRMIAAAGGTAQFVRCDVGKEDEVEALVAETVRRYGRLDFAHNNAGVLAPLVPITDTTLQNWQRVMNVNVEGMMFCLKHEVRAMLKTGGGAIVNTASTGGLVGRANNSAYATSKWAVNGLTKTAALEFAKDRIRVNSICPGMTLTPLLQKWIDEEPVYAKQLEQSIPLQRMASTDEQAQAAVWLCSDRASYVTGVNLAVDGGETA